MKSLRNFIKESKIEDPSIVASMDDFYLLQEEINQLSAKLKEAKKQFGEYGKQITPLLDSMQETGEKLAETDDYLIKIKRFAHERSSASYKNAFEMALGKVNSATRNILEESLTASKKITNIGHSFEIGTNESESIDENILSKMIQGLKSVVKKFIGIFKRESRNIDNANKDLKDLSSGKMESVNEAYRVKDKVTFIKDPNYIDKFFPKGYGATLAGETAVISAVKGGGKYDIKVGGIDYDDVQGVLFESLTEGVIKRTVMVPKEYEIKYDMNMSLFDWTDSEEDAADSIASALGLQSGYIEYGGGSTEVKGITEKGKSIVIKQDGEFDMYGGPYDPKMGKPTVIYDGKNITKKVEAALFKDYGSPDGSGGKNNHDISRVDLWGHILT